MARVALVFGGRTVEHKVSVVSARTVADALRDAGHEVIPCGIARNGVWLDLESAAPALAGEIDALDAAPGGIPESLGSFLAAGAEVVFPIVHGTWGEDGSLQGLCEMLDLPYVGAGVTTSALAMDKLLCKRQLHDSGLPVVDYEPVHLAAWRRARSETLARLERLPVPSFVKPSVGGSSVGIRRVGRREELADAVDFALRFDRSAIVERAVVGRELECSVLGYERLEASVIGEIVPGADFYDYADKYLDDKAELLAPARLDEAVASRLRELAIEAFAALGGSGMARVDFLLESDGRPWINEINTLPGFTAISMYPRLWEVSGLPLPALVGRLVDDALARHRDRRRLDGEIRDFLAGLE
jgi:D-alanine-D-alanine ligase